MRSAVLTPIPLRTCSQVPVFLRPLPLRYCWGPFLNGLYCKGEVSALKIAQIGQYAENVYFGKPCGLMDQAASSIGQLYHH